jgi:uncharacterized protein (TIGR00251 family)
MAAPSTRLHVRVSPGSHRTELAGRYGDAWRVRVAAAPERGRANQALLRLLADTLGLSKTDVSLVSGHAGRDKVVELRGLGEAEVVSRLEMQT